ncbi:MAG: 50S ribosomal protein L24 [Bacteroidetes bacterium]|nr:MAG: 50S ribosomal protein L24 [Bacteroidota bacterium]
MAKKLHIKKDDRVRVLCGNDRGREGRVLRVFPKDRKAIVEGINMVRKHMKPSQQYPDGGILEQEAPIDVSNLMVIDGSNNPTRIGRKRAENGKGWVRVSKKSGEIIK